MRLILSTLVCLVALTTASVAETLDRTVKANRKSKIYIMAIYDPDSCRHAQIPTMKVIKEPKHGKLTWAKGQAKLNKKTFKCAGKTIKVLNLYYTPKRGYRGEDEFRIRYGWYTYISANSRRSHRDLDFDVQVR